MTTDPIKLSAADILQIKANDLVRNEADAIPVADRAALCCAVDHPLTWTAASGEQFTITKPELKDGAVYIWVNAARDGTDFYYDDAYLHGLTDFVADKRVDTSGSIPVYSRDWVSALQKCIENMVLR